MPTWNYQVVHVHGKIAIHDDERFVRGVVARLTRRNEGRAGNRDKPWRMTDSANGNTSTTMLTNIVGIEVAPERIVVKSKLSQNKDDRDRLGAAEELEETWRAGGLGRDATGARPRTLSSRPSLRTEAPGSATMVRQNFSAAGSRRLAGGKPNVDGMRHDSSPAATSRPLASSSSISVLGNHAMPRPSSAMVLAPTQDAR